MTYTAGDVIAQEGDDCIGIYVIVSGMIKITYDPKEEDAEVSVNAANEFICMTHSTHWLSNYSTECVFALLQLRRKYGALPIKEIYRDPEFSKREEDYFSSGAVIGESSFLLRRKRQATVVCETDGVTAYFIPKDALDAAIAKFSQPLDTLEARMWRSCGIRRAMAYLPTTPFYEVDRFSFIADIVGLLLHFLSVSSDMEHGQD
jgi:CRP-like cAMP-binding protein